MAANDLLARVVDQVLEFPVAPSFTRAGIVVRSRLESWDPPVPGALRRKVVVVTGATSGLGLAAADRFLALGARVVVVGRNDAKTEGVAADLRGRGRAGSVETALADLGDLDAVRRLGAELSDRYDRIDVLVHNAGALSDTRRVAPSGIEATIASQVVGPFLLTDLLLPRLQAAGPGRVLTMASGGMYGAPLSVDGLQMTEQEYRGADQYARAKRAQVTLNEEWAARVPADDVLFHALHPGWADTPGVAEALPTFRRIVGPALRSPAEGIDTLVWLATAPRDVIGTGGFWHDRRRRPLHRMGRTRRSDTPDRRRELWRWCEAAAADASPA